LAGRKSVIRETHIRQLERSETSFIGRCIRDTVH